MRGIRPLPAEPDFLQQMRAALAAGMLENTLIWSRGSWQSRKHTDIPGLWTIVLMYEECPVWQLTCTGAMSRAATPCLRAALYNAHAKGEFHGGRGMQPFEHAGFVYKIPNLHYPSDEWAAKRNLVEGCEEVYRMSGELCGRQYFRGMLLVEPVTLEPLT